MPPRPPVPWDATIAEHLGVAEEGQGGAGTPNHAWIGRTIDDRYRIVELLGEGGMGAVFVAEHLKLRKQVAIKTIRPEFAGNDQAQARFGREALATAQLEHPHVASAIDYGHIPEGGAYLVTQLVRGESLASHLDRHGKIGWGTVADLGSQIADALAAAHGVGIVHRDLKPDNILIETRDDGRLHAMVVDFGIARVAEESAATSSSGQPLTRMGSILGTPGYMAPEQAVGDSVDARGDLYSLGVILWECCVGRRLWQGESITELVACQLGSTAPTLQQELGGQVPEPLSELVAALLSPAASRRPQAAGPVRDTLRRLALTQTVPTDGRTVIILPPTLIPAPPRWTTAIGDHWQTIRQRPTVIPALVGALVLLITCGVLLRGGEAPAPTPPPPTLTPTVALEPTAPPTVPPPVSPVARPPEPAAPAPAPTPTPAPATAPATPTVADDRPLPGELAPALATLLTSDDRRARKRAADRLLAHKPKDDVPAHALNVAWLEKAGSCPNKRGVILKMEAAGDPRVLPALRRLAATGRRGCGFFKSQDCFACLREPLARALGRLQSSAPAP